MKQLFLLLALLSITLTCYAQGEAGLDKYICAAGQAVQIGTPAKVATCYIWASANGLQEADRSLSSPTVNPAQTTTYVVVVIQFAGAQIYVRADEVTVFVRNAPLSAKNVNIEQIAPTVLMGAGVWGLTVTERMDIDITACSDGTNWRTILTGIKGYYSTQARLLPGVQEVTGPAGNTIQANFCKQATDLQGLSRAPNHQWFMLRAIQDHEAVHVSRLLPILRNSAADIERVLEQFSVPDNGQTQQQAIAQIKALPAFVKNSTTAFNNWGTLYKNASIRDHRFPNGAAYIAEQVIVNPMAVLICNAARAQNWQPACPACN
jgi:hypothetical protein